MLKIRFEYDEGKHIYNLLYPIYRVGGFNMELHEDKLSIEIHGNSVKARQIVNSILRLTDLAERLENVLKEKSRFK